MTSPIYPAYRGALPQKGVEFTITEEDIRQSGSRASRAQFLENLGRLEQVLLSGSYATEFASAIHDLVAIGGLKIPRIKEKILNALDEYVKRFGVRAFKFIQGPVLDAYKESRGRDLVAEYRIREARVFHGQVTMGNLPGAAESLMRGLGNKNPRDIALFLRAIGEK